MRGILLWITNLAKPFSWIASGIVAGAALSLLVVPIATETFVVSDDWPEYRTDALTKSSSSSREATALMERIDALEESSTDPELLALSRALISSDTETRQILWSLMRDEANGDKFAASTLAGWRVDTALALLTAGFALSLTLIGRSSRVREDMNKLSELLTGLSISLATMSALTLFGSFITLVLGASLVAFSLWSYLIAKGAEGRSRTRGFSSVAALLFALVCILVGLWLEADLALLVWIGMWSAVVSLVATWVLPE